MPVPVLVPHPAKRVALFSCIVCPMQNTRAIDAGLIDDFMPFTVQDYESLRYTNDRSVKDAFIAGDLPEPHLRYSDVEILGVKDRLERLAEFESVVLAHGDERVRRAYVPRIEEVRHKYHLLEAAGAGDDVRVFEMSRLMYGAPRKEYFQYALSLLSTRIDRVRAGFGTRDRVAHALDMLTSLVNAGGAGVPLWAVHTFPPMAHELEGSALTAREIRDACEQAFLRFGISDWHAVIDAPGERTTFNTNQTLRTVFIPSDEDIQLRKYVLTRQRVDALLAHEVGTHVVRRARGLRSPLALLGTGLASYLRGEEGIATYREQRVSGAESYAGAFGYLAVSWAAGLDGTPRTFRELFDVLVPYVLVSSLDYALTHDEPVQWGELERRVVRSAWARCVRVFRGTSGATAGACFTKDIVYLEGNVAIWELVTRNAEVEATFDLGKYDPANPEHCKLLADVGML